MSRRRISDQDDDAVLAAYRAAACAEADAHFDERTLETQRHRILARLAHLGNPAKVLRFPKAPAGELPSARVNRRWISVAAAAGLLIGILGGELLHLIQPAPGRPAPAAASIAPAAAPLRPAYVSAVGSGDDRLLEEIDYAVQRRSAAELQVLAELTLGDQ